MWETERKSEMEIKSSLLSLAAGKKFKRSQNLDLVRISVARFHEINKQFFLEFLFI